MGEPAAMSSIIAHPLLSCLGFFVALWICLEAGRRLGRNRMESGGESSAIDGAIFALFGLLIAFTFSGAAARFDHRRDLIVEEANAIGTAYLRIDIAPTETQPALRNAFTRYIASRRDAYAVVADEPRFRAALARSNAIQAEIWTLANAAGRRPDALPATNMLLLPAINAMIDITTTRAMAIRMHPPLVIYAMLVALAMLGAVLAGHGMRTARKRPWLHPLSFAAIMTLTIYVILDIEYPRFGFISLEPFEQETFALALPK